MFYTIGERHGFTIQEKTAEETPYYVIGKDLKENKLIVSHIKPNTKTEHIELERVSFVGEEPPTGKLYEARGRYRAPLAKIKLHKDKEWKIKVIEGELLHTSGQSVVIYDGETCIGGGIMK